MTTKEKLNILTAEATLALKKLMDFARSELSDEVTPFDILEYVNDKYRIIPTLGPVKRTRKKIMSHKN